MNPIPRRATQAMKSVVVVSHRKFAGDYCTGFVAVAKTASGALPSATLVVAPSTFVTEPKRLNVCFFDGVFSRAELVSTNGDFCLLKTKIHTACEEVNWMEFTSALFTPSPTFMLPPISRTNTYYQPTFTIVESTESYLVEDCKKLAVDSTNFFLVSCNYEETTHGGVTRLRAAPVFAMGNGSLRSMGVVLQDCREGSKIRVAITATYFKDILKSLIGPEPPSPPRREEAQKQ